MNSCASPTTVLLVPGLREHVSDHWQTLLATRLPRACTVPPGGRENLELRARTAAIERRALSIAGPLMVVAHSAGVIAVLHWLRGTQRPVQGALLVTPPDFERPLGQGYPSMTALGEGGWLPVPRDRLPCPSIVAASRNDPLASFDRVVTLAAAWGSRLIDLGEVGHLNPASGFGEWPAAEQLLRELECEPGRAAAATDSRVTEEFV